MNLVPLTLRKESLGVLVMVIEVSVDNHYYSVPIFIEM